MSINHSSSDIAVTKKRLYCADVIVGLQEVRGKTVPESVGGHAFRELRPPDCLVQRLLDVCFMKMIPPPFLRIFHESQ